MNCSFCKKDVPKGRGKIRIKTGGKIFSFCSPKCEKNLINLGRKPFKVKWVKKPKK